MEERIYEYCRPRSTSWEDLDEPEIAAARKKVLAMARSCPWLDWLILRLLRQERSMGDRDVHEPQWGAFWRKASDDCHVMGASEGKWNALSGTFKTRKEAFKHIELIKS